ncbi:MAG: hypothetical protein N3D15_03700 [Syntrophorhabdaceae bacterium]|nr:hypothetical protein [Syntrophorhabdaceae bacterium]
MIRILTTLNLLLFFLIVPLVLISAQLGVDTPLSRDTQPVFSEEMKKQLEGRERPTQQMIKEGKLSPGTWTVKIIDNKVIQGHNPVNTAQPLYNFTMNGVTYTFDRTQVSDPALMLKTIVIIQTKGTGALNLNDPETKEAVKQLEKMSNGTLHITPGPTPPPPPPPAPGINCVPSSFVLNMTSMADMGVVFIDPNSLPATCTVGKTVPSTPYLYIQNPHTSCDDAGMLVFAGAIPGSTIISTGTGFTTYNGKCGAGVRAVNASSIDNEFTVQIGSKKYKVKFSVSNGGLQSIPYKHSGRFNSITVYNVSFTEQP